MEFCEGSPSDIFLIPKIYFCEAYPNWFPYETRFYRCPTWTVHTSFYSDVERTWHLVMIFISEKPRPAVHKKPKMVTQIA